MRALAARFGVFNAALPPVLLLPFLVEEPSERSIGIPGGALVKETLIQFMRGQAHLACQHELHEVNVFRRQDNRRDNGNFDSSIDST